MDKTSRVVSADSHFTEALLAHLLIVLVEHVEEVLLDLVQVQEYAQGSAFHLQNNLIDQLVSRVFVLVLGEVASVEDLVLSPCFLTKVLDELQCVLLVVCYDHQVPGLQQVTLTSSSRFRFP